ncbi:hypothetical protein [Marinomonas mediterranea]|uniref:hypothetical protein n=1 Tax=Marinomonas mediterranea TaxID=119864 RepID=UPI00234AE62A|nr:hypothetical protein [Marinomonas mediterranea]WCN10702.1 hypothetical protein GV055_18105 [Marinomonas mediterranea]
MNAQQALNALINNPLTFLRKNALTPYAAQGRSAGAVQYRMVSSDDTVTRPGTVLGNLKTHNDGQRFKMRADNFEAGTSFQAVYIPVQSSDKLSFPHPLPSNGPRIMITTQLTGCCMLMMKMGEVVGVAHLQPTGETGNELHARLGTNLKVYGRPDYGNSRAIFIGIRTANRWRFYAQRIGDGYGRTILGAEEISL